MNDNNLKKLIGALGVAAVAFFTYFGYEVVLEPPDEEPTDTVVEPPDTTPEPADTTAPYSAQLTAVPVGDVVEVAWTAVPDSTDVIWLVWSPSGLPNTGSRLATLEPHVTAHTDDDIAPGETRLYRTILVDDGDMFYFSDWAPATRPAAEPPDTTAPEPPDTTDPEPPDTTVGEVGEPIGEWPDNEPPGMTPLTLVDGSSLDWGSGWNKVGVGFPGDTFPTRLFVVFDPASKYGSAIEKRYFIGDISGWGWTVEHQNIGPRWAFNRDGYDEIYVRFVFKYSPNWDYHSGGEKLFMHGASTHVKGGGVPHPTATFPTFPEGEVTTGGYAWLPIIPGQPTPPAIGANEGRQQGYFPAVTKDKYHTVEIWKRRNDPGQVNGAMRWWLNGVEYTRFYGLGHADEGLADVSFDSVAWNGWSGAHVELPMYWGGQNDAKTVDDWIRISEVYISGKAEGSGNPDPETHEPAGMTLIGSFDGSVKEVDGHAFGFPGFSPWSAGNSIELVDDSTNPVGSGKSLRFTWRPNVHPSAGITRTPGGLPGGPYQEVYVRWRIVLEDGGWDFGHKFFYLARDANLADGNTITDRPSGGTPRPLRATGGDFSAYSHNDAFGSTGVNRYPLRVGEWMTLEYHVRQASPGTTDGFVRLWVDGDLVAETLGLDPAWDGRYFNFFEWYGNATRW